MSKPLSRFLLRMGLFLLISGILFGGILGIAIYNHKFVPSDMYYAADFNRAFLTAKDFECIVLGNSKATASINKEVLEEGLNLKMVNLGYSSANISVSRMILDAYLANSKQKPSLVLLEVSWFTFNTKRTHLHNVTGDLMFYTNSITKYLTRYYPKSTSNLHSAIIRQWQSYKGVSNTSYADRFLPSTPDSKEYEFTLSEFEQVFPKGKAGIDSVLLEDFYWIVNKCKAEKIPMILYTAPEDRLYTQAQKDRIKVFDKIKNIDVPYLDYTFGSDLWQDDFENWLFNSHHVNENQLFSTVLVRDIEKLLK